MFSTQGNAKDNATDMQINVTIWVVIDITRWLDKIIVPRGCENTRKIKSAKEFVDKEYGAEFSMMFDIALDISQLGNRDLVGAKFTNYLDNYAVDAFMQNLDTNRPKKKDPSIIKEKRTLYGYRELKCQCGNDLCGSKEDFQFTQKSQAIDGSVMSFGETFI